MSKIITIILAILLLSVFFIVKTPTVSADPERTCPVRTEQDNNEPLTNQTRKAKFIINVGNNTFYPYKMEFKCGVGNHKEDADKEPNGQEISYTLNRAGGNILGTSPCEFDPGPHEIWVKAIVNGEKDQCKAVYHVSDSDTLCNLIVEPKTGITPATILKVSGEKLTAGGQFKLFIDNNPPPIVFLSTPNFPAFQIPNDLMLFGEHKIDIRRWHPIGNGFGTPLCPVKFTVGTPDNPGAVITSGTTPTGCTEDDVKKGRCTSGGGLGNCDPGKPTIRTAIGCIHTNPAALMKDLLTFAIGISGGLAFLMMLLGAFQMVTSAGNPETLQAGKDRLTSAVIGLLFIIFAVLLLQIIGVDILGIPGFGR